MDVASIKVLLEPAGWALLAELPPYDPSASLALGTALRESGIPADLVAAALTQSRLRAKATAKFGDIAHDMLFTPDGLEQATRLTLAARHAHRYRVAGAKHVADLGCGIGADSMALAGMDLRVLAVEKDPTTALVASVNLRQLPEAKVERADAFEVSLEGIDAIWADPARRSHGRRTFRLQDYSPAVEGLLDLRASIPMLGMKLGPGIAHRDLPRDAFAQWISAGGQVLEADLWFGDLAPEGPGRSAMVVDGDGSAQVMSGAGDPTGPVTTTPSGRLCSYVYEVDGAVMRAGLVHRVAEQLGGHLLDPTIAFITTERYTPSPWASGFRVIDDMPFSLKRLRSYLRERQVGRIEIKKRGSALDPAKLRSQLTLRGSKPATIILTRVAGEQRVLVVERMPAAAAEGAAAEGEA